MKPYYRDLAVTIYHGDCQEILVDLPKVDLVLTDPPYGLKVAPKGHIGSINCAITKDYGKTEWDNAPPTRDLLNLVIAQGGHVILWGGNFFGLPASSCWLVWDKDNSADFADCELAWTNLKSAVRKFKWRWNGMLQENMTRKDSRCHPTQKPLALMKWCIGLAGPVSTVIDPFMGSGTTLRAAKDMGLHAIGIDREERYCEIAARRMAQEVLPFDLKTPPTACNGQQSPLLRLI